MTPIDEGVLAHATEALRKPGDEAALCSFADHLNESVYAESPWADATLRYLQKDYTGFVRLMDRTTWLTSAKDENQLIDGMNKSCVAQLVLTPRAIELIRVGQKVINSWLPTFHYSYKNREWTLWVQLPVKRYGAVHARRTRKTADVSEVARTLLTYGEIGSLTQAVLGMHYFALSTFLPPGLESSLAGRIRRKQWSMKYMQT